MSQFTIIVSRKHLRQPQVEKLVRAAFDEETSVSVSKYNPPTSRADRFSEAEGKFDEAKGIIEELKDELQSWLESLPENLQQSDKGTTLQESVDTLDNLHSELEGISFEAPEFPSMY